MAVTRSMKKKGRRSSPASTTSTGSRRHRRRENFKKGVDKDKAKERRHKLMSSAQKSSRKSKTANKRGLDSDATTTVIVSCGSNENEQGGFNNISIAELHSPMKALPNLDPTKINKMSIGSSHGTALMHDNTVLSWGNNSHNVLGRCTTSSKENQAEKEKEEMELEARPTRVGTKTYIAVAAGGSHTVLVTSENEVEAVGAFAPNTGGVYSLSVDGEPQIVTFEGRVEGTHVVEVFSGRDHCAALMSDGGVFTMGLSGPHLSRSADGEVDFIFRPVNLDSNGEGQQRATRIACGEQSLYVVTERGDVFSCGRNTCGELGHGDTATRHTLTRVEALDGKVISDVAAGDKHVLFLSEDGSVFACGWGDNGELGIGEVKAGFHQNTPVPIKLPEDHSGEITHISAGESFSAVATDTLVLTFGMGVYGRLGHGNESHQYVPKRINAIAKASFQVKSISAGGWSMFVCGVCEGAGIAQPSQDAIIKKEEDGGMMDEGEDEIAAETGNKPPLSEIFRPPPGTWRCPRCFLRNKVEESECVCVREAAPSPSAGASVVTGRGGFTFGGAAEASSASGGGTGQNGGFTFGGAAASAAAPSFAGGFTFGGNMLFAIGSS